MGRYINTGATTGIPNARDVITQGRVYPRFTQSRFLYSCDPNECWPNRVLIDAPGSYTFTVPSGASCARAVLVGGGGKFGCRPDNRIFSGAGGAYAEKFFAATPGTTMTVVVGAQQQNTTLSYPTQSLTVTAGGATFCTAGTATGGDINSTGGCAGFACANSFCATNYSTSCVACCGYCVVIGCMIGFTDSGIQQCCALLIPGGASAGSFMFTTGGAGTSICETASEYTASGGAGGGGGIGTIQRCIWNGAYCNCICSNGESFQFCYPGTAAGGGGTKFQFCLSDMCYRQTYNGACVCVLYSGGIGHLGGCDMTEGLPDFYHSRQIRCCNCHFYWQYITASRSPTRYPWHDIYDISGTGSVGKSLSPTSYNNNSDCVVSWGRWSAEPSWTYQDAGEGAGTGGVYYNFCEPSYFNLPNLPTFIDFTMVCCLGTTNRIDEARCLRQRWFPNVLGCAGTLGGSGGVAICNFATMAGIGGGAGGFKRFIVCVCHGGAFDCCAQAANTPLAFPPSCLDYMTSNAGRGMAILYWR